MCGIVLCFKKCQQQICEAISVKGALASSATPLRAPLCLMCLDLKKCAQNEMKCSRFLFFFLLELIFLEFFFSGKFVVIRLKILRTRKNLPAPSLVIPPDRFHNEISFLHICNILKNWKSTKTRSCLN